MNRNVVGFSVRFGRRTSGCAPSGVGANGPAVWRAIAQAAATVVVFALCHTWAMGGGLAPATHQTPGLSASETTPVGHLAWEITETSTGRTLGKGSRTVTANEVQVISDDRGYLEQRIPLSDLFFLKLNAGRSEEPFGGFGMAAGKEDEETFCWEWFHVTAPMRARKLQESGALEFRAETIGDSWEIVHTRFTSDISLRVVRWPAKVGGDPTWRVKILTGSEIEWPVLAGKKVLLARDANAWIAAHPPRPGMWESLVQVAEESSRTDTQR